MKRFLTVALTGLMTLAALAIGGDATTDAASITYVTSSNSKTQTGFVPQFNPSLGTLAQVDITVSGQATGDLLVTQPAPSTLAYFLQVNISLIPATGPSKGFGFYVPFTATVFPNDREILTSESFAFSGVAANTPALLAGYSGLDRFNAQIATMYLPSDTAHFRPAPVLNFAAASIAVTYLYLLPGQVPEPPSAVLGLIALVVLAAARNHLTKE